VCGGNSGTAPYAIYGYGVTETISVTQKAFPVPVIWIDVKKAMPSRAMLRAAQ